MTAAERMMNLLGLAERARLIATGGFAVEKAIVEKKAKLVIVTEDASERTKNKFADLAEKYSVPFSIVLDKESLAKSVGKDLRSAAALLDEGFSESFRKILTENGDKKRGCRSVEIQSF